mmetsp:Transcript_11978/g.44557  ORF Transcript_11978/g.44557 Transcript_11978/m.44557 type:complete len:201 (+) Transcript_11978:2175-2777(+)
MSCSSSLTDHSSTESGDTPWHATRFLALRTTSLTFFCRSSATAATMVLLFLSFAIFSSSVFAFAGSMPRSAGSVTLKDSISAAPLPSVSLASAFLRKSAILLSGEITFSISTPSCFMRRTSAMVKVPIAICACISPIIFLLVMPLMIRCASGSGSCSDCWISFSFSLLSAVKPFPSPRSCSACARNALSASPLCTVPTSI